MSYGEAILSKVIDTNDPTALTRYGIREHHFETEAERKAFRMITEYAEHHRGQAPSAEAVAMEVPEFTYMPTEDAWEFLAEQLTDRAAKIEVKQLLEGEVSSNFEEMSGKSFLEWLQSEVERVKIRTDVRKSVGIDAVKDIDKFWAEYQRRKSGESLRIWKSSFPTVNREIGGYISGNLYTLFGRSGRGKSVIALTEAINVAMQGATVLVWAMEMSWFEVMVRLYVLVSGMEGVVPREYTKLDMDAGFNAQDLRFGKLGDDFEEGFRTFLTTLSAIMPGKLIVKAADDEAFTDRSLHALRADIEELDADYVVVDPFYYLAYERNTSKTAGGDAAATSQKLRFLASRTKTVIVAITQADETKEKPTDDGEREIKLPSRDEVKKTKQLLEDAYNLIAVDTDYRQGIGRIGLLKGRDGGEGVEVEILYNPNYGVVREMSTGEVAAAQFEAVF